VGGNFAARWPDGGKSFDRTIWKSPGKIFFPLVQLKQPSLKEDRK
jgi:hypothetical protein